MGEALTATPDHLITFLSTHIMERGRQLLKLSSNFYMRVMTDVCTHVHMHTDTHTHTQRANFKKDYFTSFFILFEA